MPTLEGLLPALVVFLFDDLRVVFENIRQPGLGQRFLPQVVGLQTVGVRRISGTTFTSQTAASFDGAFAGKRSSRTIRHCSRAPGTTSTILNAGPLADMLRALQDEIEAVKKQARDHPIRARVARNLGQMPDGGFWYEAQLDLPGDSELPVPEGVQIKLRWPYHLHVYPCEAKLLSYHPLNSTIIFEVERPRYPDFVLARGWRLGGANRGWVPDQPQIG